MFKGEIEKSIVQSLAFFDIFSYPLTAVELWEYGNVLCDLSDVVSCLDDGRLDGRVESKNGFYFLSGRSEIVEQRMRRYNLADAKFQIAMRAIRKLRYLNGVKMVAVCNNFSYREESDIDFFIVVQRGRMWLTRFMITTVVHFLGLRRHGKKIANRVCLSFYITDDNLNLNSITLDDDPYFYYWLLDLIPVYDDGVYEKLWRENDWLLAKLPNAKKMVVAARRSVVDDIFSIFWKKLNSVWLDCFIGSFLEKIFRYLQMKKMSGNLNSLARENDTRVIIGDKMLKFHEGDRRVEYREEMRRREGRIFN